MTRSRRPGIGLHSSVGPNPHVEVTFEPEVLGGINRRLQARLGHDFRSLGQQSPHQAVEILYAVSSAVSEEMTLLTDNRGKEIVSEYDDGPRAVHGIARMLIDDFPDPGYVPVDVVISVYDDSKRRARFSNEFGNVSLWCRFETEPPSLAF